MEPKDKVTTILNQVSELSESEKLVLFLKLSDIADESNRDPPTQMSERSNLALSWIKTHYVEDSDIFMPKQDVYEQYRQHCQSTGNKNPLSSGDFGKVMKLVFPHIHHRRLGQRGQSRYFYKGLRKKENIDTSSPTEALSDVRTKLDLNLFALSCQLVCEWAMQLLGRPFVDIRNLSEYLVSKGLSCGKTAAKFSLLSGSTSPPKLFDRDRKSPNSKHHDRQILLQRKLQHNELIREHKEKLKQQQKQLREQHSATASLGRSSLNPDASLEKGVEPVTSLTPGIPGRKILPRPLSVQPYVHTASSSYTNKKQDIVSFTPGGYKKSAATGLSSVSPGEICGTQVTSSSQMFAAETAHLTGMSSLVNRRESNCVSLPPKRCHSTSVVEKQSSSLLFSLLELTEPTVNKNSRLRHRNSGCEIDDEKVSGLLSPADHSSTPTDVCAISSSSLETVSTGLSSSSLVHPLSNAQRNITRMLESPVLRVSSDGLLMPQHPKRYGDNISPDRSSLTKRKCTTSLGVTKQQSLETSVGLYGNSDNDVHRSRPYSCPVSTDVSPLDSFGSEGKSSSHSLFEQFVHSWDTMTSSTKVKLKDGAVSRTEAVGCDKKVQDDKKKTIRPEEPKKTTSLCHVVQKPTVINRPQQILHTATSCSDLKQDTTCIELSQAPQEAITEKQSNNILNSLLSSSCTTTSDSLSSFRTLPSMPLSSPLTSSFLCTSTTALSASASLPGTHLRLVTNSSHMIDSPSILSSLSSRSAFVPVTSHKLQVAPTVLRDNESMVAASFLHKQLTECVTNKDQEPVTTASYKSMESLSHDCTQGVGKSATLPTMTAKCSMSSANSGYSSIPENSDTVSNYGTAATSNSSSSSSSSSSSTLCRSGGSMSSGCESVLTTPVPAVATATTSAAVPVQVVDQMDEPLVESVKNIPVTSELSSCSPVLHRKPSPVECTAPVQTSHSFQTQTTTSSVTPAKRTSRNRFTPIRPKLHAGNSTPSPQKLAGVSVSCPQKTDMRSVSTILKEQRMKCAQDLLVNLAHSYQGNVKLQLPAELLGLSPGTASKCADVCVTIRSPGSSSSSMSALPPRNNQLASTDANQQLFPLPSPILAHKEITVVVEPVSQSPVHSTLSPALSSCLISPTPNQLLQSLQQPVCIQAVAHNTVLPNPLLLPITTTHLAHQAPIGVSSAGAGSQVIIMSPSRTYLPSAQTVDSSLQKPVLAEGDGGSKLLLDQTSAAPIIQQNLQHMLDNNQAVDSVVAPSNVSTAYMSTSCHGNVSDVITHTIGPDSNGQAYLLVPNPEQPLTTTISADFLHQQSSSASAAPLVETISKNQLAIPSMVSCPPLVIQPPAASSSALLSELSQLASSASQNVNRQTLIQHNSGTSAFHKCPSSTDRKTDINKGSNAADTFKDALFQQVCDQQEKNAFFQLTSGHQMVEKNASCLVEALSGVENHQESIEANSDSQTCEGTLKTPGKRKRKASSSQYSEHEDKKRLNSVRNQVKDDDHDDDDVFIVKIEDHLASQAAGESLDAVEPCTAGKSQNVDHMCDSRCAFTHTSAGCEGNKGTGVAAGDPKKIFMDTETLLGMIENSKSMTVKETIKALNELRAKRLQNGNKTYSSIDIDGSVHRERPAAQEPIGCHHSDLSSQIAAIGCSKDVLSASKSNQRSVVANRTQSARCNSVSPLKPGDVCLYSTRHQDTVAGSDPSLPKVERTGRRHISLNLESLESDALLDTEPALDHKLVGDIRDNDFTRSDQKTSIGVAVKSAKSKSLRLLSDRSADSKSKQKLQKEDIKSSKATLLNDKKDLDKVFSCLSTKETISNVWSNKIEDPDAMVLQGSSKEKKYSKHLRHSVGEALRASGQQRSIYDMLEGGSIQGFVTCTSATSDTTVPTQGCHSIRTPLSVVSQSGDSKASEHPVLAHCLSVPSASLLDLHVEVGHCQATTKGVSVTDCARPTAEQKQSEAGSIKPGLGENELPGDIADFITESMSAGNAYSCSTFRGNSLTTLLADLVRNGTNDRDETCSHGGQNATVWRSISVPNTITNGYYDSTSGNRQQSSHNMSSEYSPVSYVRSLSASSIVTDSNMGQPQVQLTGGKEVWESNTTSSLEANHSLSINAEIVKEKDVSTGHSFHSSDGCMPLSSGTFLSPIGPAKLTRRSSVERSSSGDRTLTKTPVEVLTHKSNVDKSLPRIRTPTDRSLGRAPIDRSHTKTPIDRLLNVAAIDNITKKVQEKSPSNVSSASKDSTAATSMQHSTKEREKSPSNISNSCRDHTTTSILHQVVRERDPHRQLVHGLVAKSPAEKILDNFLYESVLNSRSLDHLAHPGLADGVKEDRSHNQTPVSDAGYSSVSQTPLSDVGYSSVSPSPVMMSLNGLFDECGRQEFTSPATIFLPVRSDSVLSMVNNSGRSSDGADIIGLTLQAASQGGSKSSSDVTMCLYQTGEAIDCHKTDGERSLLNADFINYESSLLQDVIDGASLDHDMAKSHTEMSYTRPSGGHTFRDSSLSASFHDVEKFMSVQLNCIPTPPHSPSVMPQHLAGTNQSPVSFSVPASQTLPPTHSHQSWVTLVSSTSSHQLAHFPSVTTISSHGMSPPSNTPHLVASSPGLVSSGGQQSPSSHPDSSRSPYGLTHPCSSPHQYNPHPSPPFTPSSQRCLASPRCPTPCSHRSLMSPRCATPCGDLNSAPNRFMPIQTSGIITTPLTATQTYIQPIRPVVTLASVANHSNSSSLDFSKLDNVARMTLSKTIPRLTDSAILDLLQRDIPHGHNTLHKSTPTNADVPANCDKLNITTLSVNCDSTSYHRKVSSQQKVHEDHKSERLSQPGLILSLTGGIGSVSGQGMQAGWRQNLTDSASPSITQMGHGRGTQAHQGSQSHCLKPKLVRPHPETDLSKSSQPHGVSKLYTGNVLQPDVDVCDPHPLDVDKNNLSIYSTRINMENVDRSMDSSMLSGLKQKQFSVSKGTNKSLVSNKNLKLSLHKESEQFIKGNSNCSLFSPDYRLSLHEQEHCKPSNKKTTSQVSERQSESSCQSQLAVQRLVHDTSNVPAIRKPSLTAMLQAPAFTAGQISRSESNSCSTDNTKPKSFHQISNLPTAHYLGTAPNVDLTKVSFALSSLPPGLTSRSNSRTATDVDLTKVSFTLSSLPAVGLTSPSDSETTPADESTKTPFSPSSQPTKLTLHSDSGAASNVDPREVLCVQSSQPAEFQPAVPHSRVDHQSGCYFVSLNTLADGQMDECPTGNPDELDETLQILKNLDSQYFQHDEDSNSPKGD